MRRAEGESHACSKQTCMPQEVRHERFSGDIPDLDRGSRGLRAEVRPGAIRRVGGASGRSCRHSSGPVGARRRVRHRRRRPRGRPSAGRARQGCGPRSQRGDAGACPADASRHRVATGRCRRAPVSHGLVRRRPVPGRADVLSRSRQGAQRDGARRHPTRNRRRAGLGASRITAGLPSVCGDRSPACRS